MKFEGLPSHESAPETGAQDMQRLSTEIMNLIQKGEFDAAEEKIGAIENEDRKNQLKTIMTFERMRKGARKDEAPQDEELKPRENLEENTEPESDTVEPILEPEENKAQPEFIEPKEIPAGLVDDLWAVFAAVEGRKSGGTEASDNSEKTKQRAPSKFTQRKIDEHRARIEADSTLSEKTKKELTALTDELQEIKKGLNVKSFSPKEAAEKRRRANDILEQLTTGAEKGMTREQIDEVLARRAVEEGTHEHESATLPKETADLDETLPPVEEEGYRHAEDAAKKVEEALRDPEKIRKVWSEVSAWVERALVPSKKKAKIGAALVSIFDGIKEIEKKKSVGGDTEKTSRNLERSIEAFSELLQDVGPEDRAKISSEDEEELNRLVSRTTSEEFVVKQGLFNHAQGTAQEHSDTDAPKISESVSKDPTLDDTQEIPPFAPEGGEKSTVGGREESLPGGAQEKETEKTQETGSMSPAEIASEIRRLVAEKATVLNLDVSGASNALDVDARIKIPFVGEVGFSTVIVNQESEFHFTNIKVTTQRFRNRVEAEIESILPKIIPKVKEHLEVVRGRKIDRLWIEEGILKFTFVPETPVGASSEAEVSADTEAEIKKVLETIPEKERPSFARRIIGMGLSVQEQKNKGFALAYGWAAEKYAGDKKPEGTLGRFFEAASENYTRAADASRTKKEALYEKKGGGLRTGLELVRSGALIVRATDPFRWFYPLRSAAAALMVAGRYGDIVKEARLKNTEALAEKTRIQDAREAEREASDMYSTLGKTFGDSSVSAEELKKAYSTTLPEHLIERLEKGGVMSSVLHFGTKYSLEQIKAAMKKLEFEFEESFVGEEEYREKVAALLEKHRDTLTYLDRVVTDTGTMDVIAETGRRAGVWSNRIATVLAVESLVEGIANIVGHLGDHEEVVSAAEKIGQPVQSSRELAENAGETEGLDLSHVEAPEVLPEPTVIEKGGNVWSAAKEIGGKFGLSQKDIVEILKNSEQTLPDGRTVSLLDLNLVHEGDSLSYVPGEHGELGHMEFHNGSDVPFGDVVSLPGAEEVGEISHENFEQEGWHEGAAGDLPLEDVVTPESLTDSIEDESPAETAEYVEPQPALESWTPKERVAYEFNRDMRDLFGDVAPERSEWQQWKGVSVKKFMEYRLEEQTPAHSLLIYLKVLMRESNLRPIGGLFRREEKIGDFVERALTAIVAKESQR